jgi:glucosamine--fructose-6-phosphate aminotransferase (isomerizing)
MLAEGFDTDRLLHGGAVPLTAADGLVVLEPAADPDGLTAALGAAAEAERVPVAVLAATDVLAAADIPGTADSGPLPPLLAQIPMTVRLQLLAERFARLRRQDPDVAITGEWDAPALWQMGAPGAAP